MRRPTNLCLATLWLMSIKGKLPQLITMSLYSEQETEGTRREGRKKCITGVEGGIGRERWEGVEDKAMWRC